MGEQATTPNAAAQPAATPTGSLAELNSQHLANRASLMDRAMAKALASKATDGTGSAPQRGTAPTSTTTPKAVPVPSASAEPASPDPDPVGDAASEDPESTATATADEPEPEASALAPELTELQELGKKKDLRALEKKLGLEEGSLGVHNGSWAAYRRRVEEADARESTLATNERTLIDRFGPTASLLESSRAGNLKAYAQVIEQTTGVAVEKFIEFWAKNVQQLDPATLQLQRENEQLRARLGAPPPETKPAAAPSAEAATAKADAYIAEEAGQHPAFKLEGAKEGVRKLWLASYDQGTKGFKLTPQQAAAEFVKVRRAAYEREQWILSGKAPPPPKRTKTLARAGASETQPRPENLTREQLIERAAKNWQRLKARGEA